MCKASPKELIEVVRYFRDEFDDLWQKHLAVTRDAGMALCDTGMKLIEMGRPLKK